MNAAERSIASDQALARLRRLYERLEALIALNERVDDADAQAALEVATREAGQALLDWQRKHGPRIS